jgi:hypothetical protein
MLFGHKDPQTKKDITWDPEKEPSYNPPSDSKALLDWSTERDKEYILSSLTRTPVYRFTALF